MTARGIRNNNPGNIRQSGDTFLGEVKPGRDGAFKTFRTMAYGYRALIKTLQTYQRKYGLRTVRQLVSRWAPDSENDTEAYTVSVSRSTGYAPDRPIDMERKDVAVKMAEAISRVECGRYDSAAAMEGFDLIHKP